MARLDPLSRHDRGAGVGHTRPAGHHQRPDLAHAAAAAGADGGAGQRRRRRANRPFDPCRGAAAARCALAADRRTCRCARTGAARAGPAHPLAGGTRHAAASSARLARGIRRADRERPAHRRTARLHRHRCDLGHAGHRRAVGIGHGAVQRPGVAFHRTAHRRGCGRRGRAERDAGRAGQGQRARGELHRPVGAGRNARRDDRQPRTQPRGAAADTAGAVPCGWAADRQERPGGGRWSGAGDRRVTGPWGRGAACRADPAARHRVGGQPARSRRLAARAAARGHHDCRDRRADRLRLLG